MSAVLFQQLVAELLSFLGGKLNSPLEKIALSVVEHLATKLMPEIIAWLQSRGLLSAS